MILVGSFIWCRQKSRSLSFGILFFTISLLPVLQIIPVGSSIISERYTYLPYIGLGFWMVEIFLFLKEKYPKSLSIQKGVLATLSLALGLAVWSRCQVWQNDQTFWSDVIKKQPLAINAYHGLGTYFYHNQDYEKSLQQYDLALEIYPEYQDALIGKALIFYELKDFEKAENYFSQALEKMPQDVDLRIMRGECYLHTKEYESALFDFNTCIQMGLNIPELYNNRAFIYAIKNDYDTAQKDWEKAIQLGTQDASVFYNLGTHYYEKGNTEKAMEHLKKATELAPDRADFKLTLDSIRQTFLGM